MSWIAMVVASLGAMVALSAGCEMDGMELDDPTADDGVEAVDKSSSTIDVAQLIFSGPEVELCVNGQTGPSAYVSTLTTSNGQYPAKYTATTGKSLYSVFFTDNANGTINVRSEREIGVGTQLYSQSPPYYYVPQTLPRQYGQWHWFGSGTSEDDYRDWAYSSSSGTTPYGDGRHFIYASYIHYGHEYGRDVLTHIEQYEQSKADGTQVIDLNVDTDPDRFDDPPELHPWQFERTRRYDVTKNRLLTISNHGTVWRACVPNGGNCNKCSDADWAALGY